MEIEIETDDQKKIKENLQILDDNITMIQNRINYQKDLLNNSQKQLDEKMNKAYLDLIEKRDDLETLAQGLLKYETLSGQEITDLLAGKTIEKYDVESGKNVEESSNTLRGGVANL